MIPNMPRILAGPQYDELGDLARPLSDRARELSDEIWPVVGDANHAAMKRIGQGALAVQGLMAALEADGAELHERADILCCELAHALALLATHGYDFEALVSVANQKMRFVAGQVIRTHEIKGTA